MATLTTLADGRVFPEYEGITLSWSIDLYNTHEEERVGYPKMRAVIRAMKKVRPGQLESEYTGAIRASFDKMFGHNARKVLAVIEEELSC
jgi:hypothetical protein